jgi:hypothetical protein
MNTIISAIRSVTCSLLAIPLRSLRVAAHEFRSRRRAWKQSHQHPSQEDAKDERHPPLEVGPQDVGMGNKVVE